MPMLDLFPTECEDGRFEPTAIRSNRDVTTFIDALMRSSGWFWSGVGWLACGGWVTSELGGKNSVMVICLWPHW